MNSPAATAQQTERRLRTVDDIAAAGANAVRGWRLTDQQCNQLAAYLADAAPEPEQRRRAA